MKVKAKIIIILGAILYITIYVIATILHNIEQSIGSALIVAGIVLVLNAPQIFAICLSKINKLDNFGHIGMVKMFIVACALSAILVSGVNITLSYLLYSTLVIVELIVYVLLQITLNGYLYKRDKGDVGINKLFLVTSLLAICCYILYLTLGIVSTYSYLHQMQLNILYMIAFPILYLMMIYSKFSYNGNSVLLKSCIIIEMIVFTILNLIYAGYSCYRSILTVRIFTFITFFTGPILYFIMQGLVITFTIFNIKLIVTKLSLSNKTPKELKITT